MCEPRSAFVDTAFDEIIAVDPGRIAGDIRQMLTYS
jgi:hypothetical protein